MKRLLYILILFPSIVFGQLIETTSIEKEKKTFEDFNRQFKKQLNLQLFMEHLMVIIVLQM